MTARIRVGAATDVGRVRDHNEDAYLVAEDLGLIAVADGMGGHRGGEVASTTALEALRIAFLAGAAIQDAVSAANEAVHDQSVADPNLRGMGTTITAGALTEGSLLLGHVGDSRAYLLREGRLQRVTTDHSLVEELIRAGELTEAEAEHDPRRSMITRALGLDSGVEIDLEEIVLADGDRVLLCSDGLTNMVSENDLVRHLVETSDPQDVARGLVDSANAAGGVDNITAVVIDVVAADGGDDAPAVDAPAVDAPAVDAPAPSDAPTEPVVEAASRRWWRRR
ncbi:MAG TPA: Stp1/IreP family PP2C-type Ser/Thr phosphatase [Acidimicrobiia bacterium]|nr:Stp1/IreP family PP2C-type Ser/Thr phosphatase [Acidimicrobiia bacterium]